MAYLGNAPVVGDSTNSFKLLDDIASFTLTFDATDTSVVSISNDTLSFSNHRFITGQKVTYTDGGGTAIGGLTDGTSYFIIKVDQSTIKLATNASNAASSTAIDLTSGAAGTSHTLKVAFDGVNTKFKATHSSGTKASISRAGQISLSINGVIQQPQDTSNPTVGYGVEPDSTIVFSTAPVATDKVFGTFIGEVAASFDITDNTVDNFTGDGSTTIFNLSREVPSSQDVLVTLDGVTQHPSDTSTTRSYSVINQALTFVSAPDTGVAIQARHIGFAGATTSEVTGFYGRTGNVALKSTDDISVQNISGVGATFTSNVNIEGVLTYEDVTNVDSIGIITARAGVLVGSGITLSKDGDIFATGVTTTGSLVSSGAISGTTGTFTGDVDIADKLIHTGDTDTFLEFGTNTVMFDTSGNERLRITSDGDVGIGINNPAAKFSIHESSSSSASSQLMRITTANGALFGIETDETVSNPTWKIGGVVNSGAAEPLAFYQVGSEKFRIDSNGKIKLGSGGDVISVANVELRYDNPVLLIRDTASTSADNDAKIAFGNESHYPVAHISHVWDGTNGALTFHTRLSGSESEKLRIDSSGVLNVPAGIGPQLRFENQHSVTADAAISTFDDSSGTMLVLGSNFYINSVGSETRYNTSEESAGIIINRNGDINLKTGGTGATATTRLSIDTDGETIIQGDANPCLSVDRGSANTTNINIKYNGSTRAQLSAASAAFEISAVGGSTPMSFFTDGTSRMILDIYGRLGINRTPAISNSKLEVGGADNVPLINVEASGATGGMGIGSGILRLYYGTVSRLNITDSTALVSASNFGASGYVRSSGPGGGSGIKLQGLAAGSGSNAVDTGISVNQGNAGGTMIVIGCRNTGAGTATQGYAWLLKFHYDGNTLPAAYNIAGTGSFWSLTLSGSNTLQINGNAGNWQFGGIWVT